MKEYSKCISGGLKSELSLLFRTGGVMLVCS